MACTVTGARGVIIRTPIRRGAMVALALAVAACGQREGADRNLDALDNELVESGSGSANTRDPAMMAALQDQIMVDPALAQQSNTDTVRPPAQPYSGAVPADDVARPPASAPMSTHGIATSDAVKPDPAPQAGGCPGCAAKKQSLTLGALVSRQPDRRTAACAGAMRYSARWAERLPADLPLYPGARVSEAAGADSATCRVRAVSFSTDASPQTVLDWYYARATGAGYSAEHQADGAEHMLGGTRGGDGGAYAVILTARHGGGTEVDLLANNGS